MCNGLEDVIAKHRPEACALEDSFLATNVKVSMKLGQVRGVVLLVAERAALEIHEYSPRLIQADGCWIWQCGKASGSGNGAAIVVVENHSSSA
jgi:Holliday junction resolvasome RuvABC endonuclease subunit